MVVAKESYAYINYRTLFLQELLHQSNLLCTQKWKFVKLYRF